MHRKGLGPRIQMARRDRGLTSEKLSELCNINATYLRQIEAGAKTPSLPIFITLCQNLRVSPCYLLSDIFAGSEADGIEPLVQLCHQATPSQLRIITAMVCSALDAIDAKTHDP